MMIKAPAQAERKRSSDTTIESQESTSNLFFPGSIPDHGVMLSQFAPGCQIALSCQIAQGNQNRVFLSSTGI
ncbi:unnamed protein product [Boreogadus saida]